MLDTKVIIGMFTTHLDADDVWRLSGEQKLEFLRALETIGGLLAAVQAEVAAHAEDEGVHTQHNCRSLAVLLRNTLNLAPAEVKKRAKVAQALPGLPKTREGLRAGVISGAHAVVIVNAVEHLPEEVAGRAEALLADYAPRLTSTQLMTAGKHIRIQVDPDGTYRDEKDPRTAEQRYADGLCDLVRIAMSTTKLPSSGGIRPQVIVTIPFTDLRDGTDCGEGDRHWDAVECGFGAGDGLRFRRHPRRPHHRRRSPGRRTTTSDRTTGVTESPRHTGQRMCVPRM